MNFWPVLVAAVKMKLNFFPPFSLQAFVKKNERRKPRSASYVNDGGRWNEVRDGPERVVPTQDFLLVERKVKFSVHPKPVKLFGVGVIVGHKHRQHAGWTFESEGGWVFVEKFFHFYYF